MVTRLQRLPAMALLSLLLLLVAGGSLRVCVRPDALRVLFSPPTCLAQANGTSSGGTSYASASSFSTSLSAANFGQALSLNGTDGAILLPAGVGKHLLADSWFVSCRILTTQASGLHVVLSNDETQSNGRPWWIGNNAGQLQASIGSGTTNMVPTSGTAIINDGTWHEIALCVSANTGYLFLDGALVATQTQSTAVSGSGNVPAIGYYARTAAVYGGQVDEVAYFSTALHTSAYTIPTSPFGNTTTGLTNLYHLDGNANDSYSNPVAPAVTISPASATVLITASRTFTASVANDTGSAGVSWSLLEGSIAGTLSSTSTTGCTYTAPSSPGLFHLVATSIASSANSTSCLLTINPPLTNQVVCDGNSLTYGLDASSQTSTSYPPILGTLLGAGFLVTNGGVSSIATPTMTTNGASHVDSAFNSTTYSGAQVVVCWEGTNDIYTNGVSAATCYANLRIYCLARRSAGWKVVIVTLLPRNNSGTPANFETVRQGTNALIRANWRSFADALADVAADSRLGLYGDQASGAYYYISGSSDSQVHLIDAGYSLVATHVQTAIQQAISGGVVASGRVGQTSRHLPRNARD